MDLSVPVSPVDQSGASGSGSASDAHACLSVSVQACYSVAGNSYLCFDLLLRFFGVFSHLVQVFAPKSAFREAEFMAGLCVCVLFN